MNKLDIWRNQFKDITNYIEKDINYITFKSQLFQSIKYINILPNKWLDLLSINGYIIPHNYKLSSKDFSTRLISLKKNLKTWKRLRNYLLYNYKKGPWFYMKPTSRHIIYCFNVDNYKQPYLNILLFLINYIPLYQIYQYDPLNNKNSNYRYYTDQLFIIYYLFEYQCTKTQYKNILKDIKSNTANGYDISNKYKIIITDILEFTLFYTINKKEIYYDKYWLDDLSFDSRWKIFLSWFKPKNKEDLEHIKHRCTIYNINYYPYNVIKKESIIKYPFKYEY